MQSIRSALFIALSAISSTLFGSTALLLAPFSYRVRRGYLINWVHLNLWMLRVICRLDYEVIGRENIPKHGAVILAKHQSMWETIALQAIFPDVIFVLKRELLKIPGFGWGLSQLEPIPIDRDDARKAIRKVMELGTQRIADERCVVIFPEGTRTSPGEKGKYQPGGGMVAHKAKALAIPVAHNAGSYWPKRGFLKKPGTIRVEIGAPIDGASHNAKAITAMAEAWIEARMALMESTDKAKC
jgi:1-acyl-sn-glycerol-3-phosphate acyltransferase